MVTSLLFSVLAVMQPLPEVSGTATYLQKSALPENAELVVRLDRIAGGTQHTIATQTLSLGGKQVPVQFKIPYLGSAIKQGESQTLFVQIRAGDNILFETERGEPVISNGKSQVELTLKPGAVIAMPPIMDRQWIFVEVGGHAIPASERMPSLQFNTKDGSISGFSGVNGFGGSYTFNAPYMQIDPGAMTMMAGSPVQMEVEQAIIRNIAWVNRAAIVSNNLMLYRGDKVIARLEPVKE